ncbi:uncharacterized protein BP5553_07603 [Venustampulla echinocandica]|uniref:Mid2 domain-containing protein n=1 Tax=Venustampulla echinocandica TaxID=2656787 RepID=A0A370TGZ5_9HELO|nr:uncharacterized protein BP5553_07603 [Venustampulla echinocandica]RDL34475.1 hypothetical protein BP5553_07603 [Venustampulla echinocandica]
MSLPATTALPDLKARHQRFFRNRQRGVRRRGDDGLVKPSDDDSVSGDDSPSDDDAISTGIKIIASTSAVTSSQATLAITTAAPLAVTTSSSVVTTSVQTTTSKQSTTNVQATTSIQSTTSVQAITAVTTLTSVQTLTKETALLQSSAPMAIPATTPAPEVLGTSTSSFPTTSSERQLVATTPAEAVGLGSVDSPTATKMGGGAIAGVVFGVLVGVLAAVLLLWLCVRRSRKHQQGDEFNEKGAGLGAFSGLGNFRRKARSIERSTESRIWGGASSSGPRTEAGEIPAYAPAFMQPGGIHAPSNLERGGVGGSLLSEQLQPTTRPYTSRISDPRAPPISPPPPISKDTGREEVAMSDDGLERPSTRWFARDSVSSVPRFRDIKSWARDQTTRTASKLSSSASSVQTGVPNMPTGPYNQM